MEFTSPTSFCPLFSFPFHKFLKFPNNTVLSSENGERTMRESNSQISSSTPRRSSNRLIFDRRYGWVLDEWKDPAEEALTGGRGMFCIVPLARSFLQLASQSINLVGSSAVKVLERREDLLSPQVLQTYLNDQLNKFVSSIQKQEFNFFTLKASQPTRSPSHAGTQRSESNTG